MKLDLPKIKPENIWLTVGSLAVKVLGTLIANRIEKRDEEEHIEKLAAAIAKKLSTE